jgi:hypothetical protein
MFINDKLHFLHAVINPDHTTSKISEKTSNLTTSEG